MAEMEADEGSDVEIDLEEEGSDVEIYLEEEGSDVEIDLDGEESDAENDMEGEESDSDLERYVAEECSNMLPSGRSGHVAVVDGKLMYVWGGYRVAPASNQTEYDSYLPATKIWIHNMETGVWEKRTTRGSHPPGMSGSCGVCVDGVLYLFGGHHSAGNTNQMYRLVLRAPELCWEEMKDLKGLPPSRKDKLGCWVYKNRLIFFGGYGYVGVGSHRGKFEYDEPSSGDDDPERGWNNHIHILDLETLSWSQPITKGAAPTPRAAHACAVVGNRGYVFGGRFKTERMNDLYYINLDTWEWHEMSVPQSGPVGRSWHSFIPMSPDHIFLFGGFTTRSDALSDAWLYCVSMNEWMPFRHKHTESPRLWHTACLGPDGEVFVFGGCASNLISNPDSARHSNKLLVFPVQPKSLTGICVQAVIQHRDRLASSWDCLPKHLLLPLLQRMGRQTRHNALSP